MSVRQALLALLAEHPRHGYQLRQEFEARTGGSWPLNIGQVYTTLARLARDGLVTEAGRPDDGSVEYELTAAGQADVAQWWSRPVQRSAPARDELAIKIAMAVTSPGVDAAAVIQRQRTESLRALQEHTRASAQVPDLPGGSGLARLLVLDSVVFAAEAEVRWLDHVEQRLARATRPAPPGGTRT